MSTREATANFWAVNVVPVHNVPSSLYPHQLDAMDLIRKGENVFLGSKK